MSVNIYSMKLVQEIVEDCCPPVLKAPLDDDEAESLAAALKVLAEPARLRLVSLIAAQPGAEACICNLTEPLGLSQPTVSYHMKVLQEAGVLDRQRRGHWVYFRLRSETLRTLAAALYPEGRKRKRSA
jgi:ArsR family transcriptional regulator